MAQIAVTPQVEAAPVAPSPPQAATAPSVAYGRFGESRPRLFPPSARWLAAAAAVLLVAAGGAGLWGIQEQQQRDAALHALAAEQGSPSALIGRILAAPDAKILEVPAPGGATMLIAHSKDAALAGVVTIGMAPAPQGKAYELWLIDAPGRSAVPAGLIRGGDGTSWNEIPGGIGTARYLGVTVEPAGGSPHPTTQPILLQQIA